MELNKDDIDSEIAHRTYEKIITDREKIEQAKRSEIIENLRKQNENGNSN